MKSCRLLFGVFVIGALLNSCIKQQFDNPPDASHFDPNLPVNLTIGQLATIAITMGSNQYYTMGDSTIYGVVTADDRSGNFYKQIVIQDSTGGMTIGIAGTNLFNDYPIGRKIYVKLKGLVLINYKGLPQITFTATTLNGTITLTGIPTTLVSNYVVKASYPNVVKPDTVRMIQLFGNPNQYLNKLVTMENMEFSSTSANLPYAASSLIAISTNRTIQDCPMSGSIIMYNSGFATFQAATTPNGKGTITGIFSIYTTPQFLIRDTTDVQLTTSRVCP
jgi:uncharacterized protein DUF5689